MVGKPVGKGVESAMVLVADLVDTVPALATTWFLTSADIATLGPAFLGGFVMWLLLPVLSRALTSTSPGGLLTGLRWVTRTRATPGFAAVVKHALFSQTYAYIALLTWAMFALLFPWRLLNPTTWKAFDVPNTELFGILVDARP